MANLLLDSKAKGDWWYEIEEDKVKVKYRIKFGFNEIPESHVKVLEKDPGFKAKLGRLYKVLKKSEVAKEEKKDTKDIDAANDLKKAKAAYNSKVSDLKKEHEGLMKKQKEEYKTEVQKLTDLRGEALRRVKELEAEKVTLSGKLAGIEVENNKNAELSKAEFDELVKGLEKELADLKVSSEKKIKALEGEKKALENKLK